MQNDRDPARQNGIAIIPSSARYAEQMEDLGHISYGTTRENPDEVFTAAMFQEHLQIFPEGQFTAIDTHTDSVVGVTVSMRMNFDPNHHMSHRWWESIGFG
jgi:hypothetical protein